MKRIKKIIFLTALGIFILSAFSASAVSIGEKRVFTVDPYYDVISRQEVSGTLQKAGLRAYFYCDENWWNTLNYSQQGKMRDVLESLSQEFDDKIYPEITKAYGFEWKPGIDNDTHITILIHPMKSGAGGYFSNINEYPKLQDPRSNEREMFYLNSDYIDTYLAKSFTAHEFVHLITFNQKERIRNVSEDIWLNEARAEYAPTLLGYDDNFSKSNLKERKRIFLNNPSNSITEWTGEEADYGALNIFIHYLVEHYGESVLLESLPMDKTGIDSLNYVLKSKGFKEDFNQIFTDWTIAVLVNDCSLSEKYCYKNDNLKDIKITPSLNFLPLSGKSTLGVSQSAKNWEAGWIKFIGGRGTIKIEFIGNPDNIFKVPYVIKDVSGSYSVNFMALNEFQRGEVLINKFGSNVDSVAIIPSIQTKILGFINPEVSVPFFWSVSVIDEKDEDDTISKYLDKPVSEMSQSEILGKIAEIEALLNQLKSQLSLFNQPESEESQISCAKLEQNLSYGLKDEKVRCLQEFLKNQGAGIYPEGLVTGYFGALTRTAVVRFQEKYASEILSPLGLFRGTGFVGQNTLAKINQLIFK